MLDFKKSAQSEPTTNLEEARGVKEDHLKVQGHFEVVYEAKQNA